MTIGLPKHGISGRGFAERIALSRSTNQNVATAAGTPVQWSVETYKNGITHSTGVNPHLITLVQPGRYLVQAQVTIQLGATVAPNHSLRLLQGGAEVYRVVRAESVAQDLTTTLIALQLGLEIVASANQNLEFDVTSANADTIDTIVALQNSVRVTFAMISRIAVA